MSKQYYKDVLGKTIWVLFTINDEATDAQRDEYFRGKVEAVREETALNGRYKIEHYIKFDDGDDGYFDINEEDREGRICWAEPEQELTAGQVKSEKRKAALSLDDAKNDSKKKSRTDEKAMNNSTDEEEGGDNYSSSDSGDSSEAVSSVATSSKESNQFKILDSNLKAWIGSLNLQNHYGAREAGLNYIDGRSYAPPGSFEQVFHLADYLFPGNGYHRRLFQTQSRPGISVRQVLRAVKKRSPNDPLVSWHEPRQEWIPPNKFVLAGMIDIICKK
mmetsp:Transcript_5261/g.10068  ORF Transcript_5261/g.10068 Transcript_5261/m.10068 type:complete len:275 (+) Transcript_5261:167-991(+)